MKKNYFIPFILVLSFGLGISPAFAWWHNDTRHHQQTVFPDRRALPNPELTPGAINPSVTQANIDQTICRPGGYTRSIRPPEWYTEHLKRNQIREYSYHWPHSRLGNFEEDHLIALSIGGNPTSPKNLWPEPHRVKDGWGSYAKDRLELKLHNMVCAHQISLKNAQKAMATNWIRAYQRYIGHTPNNQPMRWQLKEKGYS